MIHGKPCHIRMLAEKFLSMSETDMELAYLLIKDKPLVKQAYDQAKLVRKKQKETVCTNNRNGAR